MTGQTLAHYRIVQKIGAGGMGEVYRARDQQLRRFHARLRLLREARAPDRGSGASSS